MLRDVLSVGWDEGSRDRQGRLLWLAALSLALLLTVTWGFDQIDEDLRSENVRTEETTR